jgi:squalene-hopene/tetraprenyl-beta-curcumene cyclase
VRSSVQRAGATLGERALARVTREWKSAFDEAAHAMPFPRAQGFAAAHEEQRGDVFARAVIADALHGAQRPLGVSLEPLIARERDYLLERRRTGGIGGWSYFPDLAELPPDADDVAQVMRVLWNAGDRAAIERHCVPAVDALLAYGRHADGGLETWIVPDPPHTREQELQAEWVRTAWGAGPDPDVMANFLHALASFDVSRYSEAIVAGANYVASRQSPDGSWRSTWYHGPYYGTYQCIRLLAAIKPDHPAVARGVAFVLGARGAHGAWGAGPHGDPLSTALALLALHASRSAPPQGVVQAGLDVLLTAESAAGWEAVPFIRMELGRAGGVVTAILSYGSRTITAAFVLQAASVFLEV